ncbi:hypothetical protein SUDANB6_03791 [Streptomyces sp. enrichment culture]|uniref:hypothetical protein n=1 Tax=Streptomyces sp. enrichment culture TaxID=1795815 RepID=UPI003F54CE39
MRATVVRRTVLASSAAALAFAATACGGTGQDGGDEGAGGDKGGAASAKPAVKAPTAAELEKLVVAPGDLEGQEVKKPGKDDVFDPAALSVGRAGCEPVARALSALPEGDPAASTQRLVTQRSAAAEKGMPSLEELARMTEEEAKEATIDSLDITRTMTSLWSYDADGAQRALAALREAGRKCAGGFTVSIDGEKQQVTKVTEEKVTAGEEAVAWTVGTKIDDSSAETKVVVFRKGATLAGFSSFNIAAVSRGEAFDRPAALIDAQEAKLG